MRQVIDGSGSDSTSLVLDWLKSGNELRLATLYLIGEAEDPYAMRLTDWESPLLWGPWGTFQPSVIRRAEVDSHIGLDVSKLKADWAPKNVTPGNSIPTASPYQLAQYGFYDNWTFRSWTAYMPVGRLAVSQVALSGGFARYTYTLDIGAAKLKVGMLLRVNRMAHSGNNGTFRIASLLTAPNRFIVVNANAEAATESGRAEILAGDANSFGASELFGGRVAQTAIERGLIKFTINSFLDVLNQQVPLNVIERLNTLAAFQGARPPAGLSVVPQFNAVPVDGLDDILVIGNCTYPTPGQIFATNKFVNGYLVFNDRPGASLGRMWGAIQSSKSVVVGATTYNQFKLYQPLPFPVGAQDTFYATGTPPMNKVDGEYNGFLYVPSPEEAI